MNPTLLTILISILVVGMLILGLSITLIRKGHHIQSEVGENSEMKRRGIKCTSQTIMDEERAIFGEDACKGSTCSMGSCSTCENS